MTIKLLNIDALAEYLGVPVKTIYNWRSVGYGPKGVRIGRHVRWRQADVDAWLDDLHDAQLAQL